MDWTLVFRHELVLSRSQSLWLIPSGALLAVLYQLSLRFGLSRHLASASAAWGYRSYAEFLTPGLVVMAVFNACFTDWIDGSYRKAHLNQFYEAILLTPLSASSVVLGETVHLTLRGVLYALGFLVASRVFGIHSNLVAMALAVPLIGIVFATVGVSIPILVRSRDQLDVARFCGVVMTMFSGVFYPVSVYPKLVCLIVKMFPFWQALNLVHSLDSGNLTGALASGIYLLGLSASLMIIAVMTLMRSQA
ncbi:lipooligosaccharide transport system permease protein [Propionibacterium cyclohexanicum]|uniref:Lipooligosaccharide transport system permease protein n=2 Tax=Propionibacterium cyclohexanicum TaxID=64702 RepID=A0A1H9R0P8_9ACTN|nr:lipooligosaccharide transport system permease protein [Propionibacterium cyclohexanicum]